MSQFEKRGCLLNALFLIWMGAIIWLPEQIYDSRNVGICGIIGFSVALASIALVDQTKDKSFKKEIPFTYAHFWMFIAYAVSSIYIVGFKDIPYEEIKHIGKSIVFYAALPVPVFFIEYFVKDKIEKKKRMEQRIQRLYQVACSHQNLKLYFQGKVESILVEYKILYRSFAGVVNKEGAFRKNKEDVANFYIECPNPECTSGYIDLRTEVLNAVEEWETMVSGVTTCCGKTAPDHPNQKCDVQIEYSIQIQYSQS